VTPGEGHDDARLKAAAARVRAAVAELAAIEEQISALQRLRVQRSLRPDEAERYESLCKAERDANARWRAAVRRHNELAGPCGSGS